MWPEAMGPFFLLLLLLIFYLFICRESERGREHKQGKQQVGRSRKGEEGA